MVLYLPVMGSELITCYLIILKKKYYETSNLVLGLKPHPVYDCYISNGIMGTGEYKSGNKSGMMCSWFGWNWMRVAGAIVLLLLLLPWGGTSRRSSKTTTFHKEDGGVVRTTTAL
jgi:uncharacterized membrane protein